MESRVLANRRRLVLVCRRRLECLCCQPSQIGVRRHARRLRYSWLHSAPRMSSPATLLMWFQLRSPELAEDFERLMAGDRDVVRGSLDTVSDWRLTRPADVPGQSLD